MQLVKQLFGSLLVPEALNSMSLLLLLSCGDSISSYTAFECNLALELGFGTKNMHIVVFVLLSVGP